jgi:hypothetical protein
VIQQYGFNAGRELLERLKYYWVPRQIASVAFSNQEYNVTLDMLKNRARGFGELSEADTVSFVARSDRSVDYALLLNIDVAGNVTVIYKGGLEQGRETALGGDNDVIAPFGVEFMKTTYVH